MSSLYLYAPHSHQISVQWGIFWFGGKEPWIIDVQLTNLQQLCDAEDTQNWYPGNVNSSKSAGVAINTTFTTAQVVWGDYPLYAPCPAPHLMCLHCWPNHWKVLFCFWVMSGTSDDPWHESWVSFTQKLMFALWASLVKSQMRFCKWSEWDFCKAIQT